MPAPTTLPDTETRLPRHRSPLPKKTARRVKIIDRLAAGVIRAGGSLVIVAVAAIFLFIGKEALPLFLPAKADPDQALTPPPFAVRATSVVGIDDYEAYTYWLNPAGAVEALPLNSEGTRTSLPIPELADHPLTCAYRNPERHYLYLGTDDGHLILTQVRFRPEYTEAGRTISAHLEEPRLIELSPAGESITRVFGRHDDSGTARFAALTDSGKLYFGRYEDGDDPRIDYVDGNAATAVTALAIDPEGLTLFLATATGQLQYWYLDDDLQKPFATLEVGSATRHVTSMEWLIGGVGLILGYSDGSMEEWFSVRDQEAQLFKPFRKIREFEPMPASINVLEPSGRNRGFLAGDVAGNVRLLYATSARTLLDLDVGGPLQALAYAPKLSRVLALTSNGEANLWTINNPHPEISWNTLFGKVWYEGYDEPDFVWQSTGGSDEFEPKLSLIPLALGTLKGAFYGLLFAIPAAVMAALYASQFMSAKVRGIVKPAVEIMAALPSVVIGFMAGLWLAPLLEHHVVSLVIMCVVTPALVLGAALAWSQVPARIQSRLPLGTDLAVISLLVILGFLVCVQLGPLVEAWIFHGDLRQWLFDTTGHQFEQRNSIVIGFAMGFAVIPIIFTISDDALTNVPKHFTSGSLALGASRWQTATRVILPTASPGIFSAIMVGFGRAVGETMIVLMATGNTPILNFSPFNGMRTLSANIAVEIPEAPVGGTLYRILFLTAILLFLLTFAVNTVAEIVRHRLRNKYQAV